MVPTSLNRTVANIGDTVKKHDNIVQHSLSPYSLIGCDTESRPTIYGLEKVKALTTPQKSIAPPMLGSQEKDMSALVIEATQFIASSMGSLSFVNRCLTYDLKSANQRPGAANHLSWHLSLQHLKLLNFM